ncbi:MAG: glycosyltransferase family 2 protein [Candidatus Shapirobacteria bacterium]|nr:glycosyltransferase family 2 protein [Candidatus Shapirobacteria bacterium]MDD5074179.1 glycosyltransferase family 2 protein [Candidatus Shapirobacteria bacterium]
MASPKLKELSVFFPFYNEEANIKAQTEQALKIIPRFAKEFEIILVNDGSVDKTNQIGQKLAAKYPNVFLVSHQKNRGYGGALKSGFAKAKYEWIFFSDGDRQFDLAEIAKLLPLTSQADLVIGYRQKRADTLIRLINAKLFNLLIRLLFGLKVADIDCAFKLLKKEVVDGLELKSDGALISSELLIKAQKAGFRITQVPVSHYPRKIGSPTGANPRVIFKAFYDIFTLWQELK